MYKRQKKPKSKSFSGGRKKPFFGKGDRFRQKKQQGGFRRPFPQKAFGNESAVDSFRKKLISRTKEQVTEQLSGKEISVVKAVNLSEDLDSAFNLFAEQLIDWHSYNFPELKRIVRDNGQYLRLVFKMGSRKNFSKEKVAAILSNPQKADDIAKRAIESIGAEFDKEEEKEIKELSQAALGLQEQKETLSIFLEQKMNSMMPSTSTLLGYILAAKMLARAGTVRKMAFMPSSKIQVLGAEKALYAHVKTGSKPPKHGIIFQHPLISTAKKENRGKIARALASKISLAAKKDFFGSKNDGAQLRKELEKKISGFS